MSAWKEFDVNSKRLEYCKYKYHEKIYYLYMIWLSLFRL